MPYEDLARHARPAGGADFLATRRDPTYPMPDGLWPARARSSPPSRPPAGRTREIVGKPEPQLFLTALDRLGEGRTLVVGDRLDSDVAGAAAAGLDAALVLSGVGTERVRVSPATRAGASPWPRARHRRARSPLLTVALRTRHVEVAMREQGRTAP